MTPAELFEAVAKLSGLLFVVTSSLAMDLSLTMAQIIQPLKNVRIVILPLLLFIVGSFLVGFLLDGREAGDRSVISLGMAQRHEWHRLIEKPNLKRRLPCKSNPKMLISASLNN